MTKTDAAVQTMSDINPDVALEVFSQWHVLAYFLIPLLPSQLRNHGLRMTYEYESLMINYQNDEETCKFCVFYYLYLNIHIADVSISILRMELDFLYMFVLFRHAMS